MSPGAPARLTASAWSRIAILRVLRQFGRRKHHTQTPRLIAISFSRPQFWQREHEMSTLRMSWPERFPWRATIIHVADRIEREIDDILRKVDDLDSHRKKKNEPPRRPPSRPSRPA